MGSKMLIDATHSEETRVVVVRGNRIDEFDFESAARKQLKGNIYLAKVTRVEPSLQAAFVDYGNAVDSRADLKPVAGIGIGARMRTPIGPIKLDLAYGEARSRFHVHFSIGHTF